MLTAIKSTKSVFLFTKITVYNCVNIKNKKRGGSVSSPGHLFIHLDSVFCSFIWIVFYYIPKYK